MRTFLESWGLYLLWILGLTGLGLLWRTYRSIYETSWKRALGVELLDYLVLIGTAAVIIALLLWFTF